MKSGTISADFAATALVLFLAGCTTPRSFVNETRPLTPSASLPVRMQPRDDLLQLSDCRVVFELTAIPEDIGIALTEFNPFLDQQVHLKTALCPVRAVMERVLREGASGVFLGNASVGETRIVLVPVRLGVSKEGGNAHAGFLLECSIDGNPCGTFGAERTSVWTDTAVVPDCVYAAAADIGDQILARIAGSTQLRERILANRQGNGTMPSFTRTDLSDVEDGAFSGRVEVDCGSWDMARVRLWVRSQIEQTAMATLGVRSMENYRIVLGGESRTDSSGRFSLAFRVFPYQGFDLEYDARTRKGRCAADLGYLGLEAEEAYDRARAYIGRMLADQGVVLTDGRTAAPAQFRFDGFRLQSGGARIMIPFELVN